LDFGGLAYWQKTIVTKGVYIIKTNVDGTMTKLKAKLIACGFQSHVGEDFDVQSMY
jgi:hypothetical protein